MQKAIVQAIPETNMPWRTSVIEIICAQLRIVDKLIREYALEVINPNSAPITMACQSELLLYAGTMAKTINPKVNTKKKSATGIILNLARSMSSSLAWYSR